MNAICANCPLRLYGCDILSEECRLLPEEVARVRLDLVLVAKNRQQAYYWRHRPAIRERDNASDRFDRWRKKNPEKWREIQRNQYAKHKDARNARRRLRRSLSGASSDQTQVQVDRG